MFIYYVYAYLRKSDGTPYYIGKGKGNRAYNKHGRVKVPRDKTKIVFLEQNLTELGAFAIERRMIRWYGRNSLMNKTDGGEGGPLYHGKNHPWFGRKHTPESKKLMSDKNKGLNHPQFGKKQSKTTIEKRVSKIIGKSRPNMYWWNNGNKNLRCASPPDTNWIRGRCSIS